MASSPIKRIEFALNAIIAAIGKITGALLIILVGIVAFDVVARIFFQLPSLALQELEWHIHTAIFCLTLGYAYILDRHIRIDLIRDTLNERKKALIECLGIAFFLIPFCLVILYYSLDYAYVAYERLEGSRMPGGLPYRWIIKSALPVGMILLLAAGISLFIRNMISLLNKNAPLDVASS